MTHACKFITHSDLGAWLEELGRSMRVVAPRAEGNCIVYRDYDPAKGLELGRKPTESAKHVLFPRSESLFSFRKEKAPFPLEKLGETATDQPGDEPGDEAAPKILVDLPADPQPTVVFGMLGCDAAGVTTFDPIYAGDSYKDVYYLKRREATILIARACSEVLSTCFCTWVGGDPANTRNADILATELEDGWLLRPLTERASAVLGSSLLAAAESHESGAARQHEAARAALGHAPALEGIAEALATRFDDNEFWWAHSAGCIGCGTCTYLCPTCHCFTITDEGTGASGVRLRAWDTCMSALYTLEASGHNPRAQKAARLRNRVGHKFSYFLKNNDGVISCCGCGRCIKSCPSSVDIRRIVLDALATGAKESVDG